MSRYTGFRLQTLFNLRERARKEAQEALFAAQQELRRKQEELDKLKTELSEKVTLRDQRRSQYAEQTASGSSTIHNIHIQERHIYALRDKEERVKVSIEEQNSVVETSQRVAQARHLEMLNANREFKSIEKLKERWAMELKKQVERKEEEATDEISQARHVNQRRLT
jgi:flagellar export protein FliJ